MSAINILVYNGPGTSQSYAQEVIKRLKQDVGVRYAVREINTKSLIHDPWEIQCRLLVIPGGRDKMFVEQLSGDNGAVKRIKQWIFEGGKYLGICAGAYFACEHIKFDIGGSLQIDEDRELGLYPGDGCGPLWDGFEYGSRSGEKEVSLEILFPSGVAMNWAQCLEGRKHASALYNGGCSFHIRETFFKGLDEMKCNHEVETLSKYDENGQDAAVFIRYGSGAAVLWGPHPELSSDPLLLASLGILGLDTTVERNIALQPIYDFCPESNTLPQEFHPGETLEGTADIFKVYATNASNPISQSATINVEKNENDEPIWPLILSTFDQIPTSSFNWELYQKHQQQNELKCFGRHFLYSDVTTSTQSILEKNGSSFTKRLPNGTLFVASTQVQGRGRSGNAWVSPKGCLMMSGVVRLPITDIGTRGVMIQYVVALAIVQGLKDIEPSLPIQLKWPNDIYADLGTISSIYRTSEERYRKIAGILVNAYPEDAQTMTLIFGCGTNIANATPSTSVNAILELLNKPSICLEHALAHIVKRLDKIWRVFEHDGFKPLLEDYLNAWMHTGSQVYVSALKKYVTIIDITPDAGLLRGRDENGKIIELMPDGNSYDIFHGLIIAK